MGKKDKADKAEKKAAKRAARVELLQAIVANAEAPKRERKAAKAELAELGADLVPVAQQPEAPTPEKAPAKKDARDVPQGASKQPVADADNALAGNEPDHQWRAQHLGSDDPDKIDAAADAVLADPNASPGAKAKAENAKKRAERLRNPEKGDAEAKARVQSKRGKKATEAEASQPEGIDAVFSEAETTQVAEEVATENGREFAVGAPTEDVPELVGAVDPIDRDHLGRPKIVLLGEDGQPVMEKGKPKTKSYTRVTTYIDCLDDTTQLEKWKLRTALEGAGIDLDQYQADNGLDLADSLVGRARRITQAYDKARAKIQKREKKGELDLGQFGLLMAEAKKAHDDALNELAEAALDLGGAHERAAKGTELHHLTELLDRGELDIDDAAQVQGLIDAGTMTHADLADLQAYRDTMRSLGIKVLSTEQFVVIDDLGVAGTLDRELQYKFPGTSRAVRCVGDLKTGRVDYAAGKIGMQLATYSRGKRYDPATYARTDLKLSKSKALLIHLPAGQATCSVYVVDIELAGQGLALAGQVRQWRNAGKKVYDLGKPVAGAEAGA